MQVIGFDVVLARDVETNDLIRLTINDLYPVSAPSTVAHSIARLAELEDRDGKSRRSSPLTRCPTTRSN